VRGEFNERNWEMFWQSVVEGRPSAVVVAEPGVSPGAVRQARARVLRRLKEEAGEVNG
jgi:RNA polymerase sigma-70 factor (ECF subfamily)